MTAQLDSFPNLPSLKFVCNREHTTCAPRSIVESLWNRAWRGGKEQKNIQMLDSKGKHTHTWQLPLSPFVSVRTLLSRLPERHRTNRWPCWQHLPTWRGSDEGCQYKFWNCSSRHYEHLRRPQLKGEKDKVNILRRIVIYAKIVILPLYISASLTMRSISSLESRPLSLVIVRLL